jgi:hypothetical protein
LDENSSFLELPDIAGAEYMVSLLSEAGFVQNTGLGCSPIQWTEIESWLRVTGLELSTWEKLTIKTMSEVYAGELSQASAKNRPQPYISAEAATTLDRMVVADKLRNVFASFKRDKSGEPEQQN